MHAKFLRPLPSGFGALGFWKCWGRTDWRTYTHGRTDIWQVLQVISGDETHDTKATRVHLHANF